jgi:endoribonuclease Dicer
LFLILSQIIGYEFKKSALLLEAMTHPSNSRSVVRNYNRLELLGDAIVDLACTLRAMDSEDATLKPGVLSDWKYVCASTEALSRVSRQLGLNRFVQHFSSKLAREIERYCTMDLQPSVWLDNPPKVTICFCWCLFVSQMYLLFER